MAAPNARQELQDVPLKLVGGNHFGRFSKISAEQTWNFIVSDNALVPYAGYKNILTQSPAAQGRGLYASSRGNIMLAVWGSNVYTINAAVNAASFRGTLATPSGDVFIAENNNGEIAITDGVHIYVYNWSTDVFSVSTTGAVGAGQFAVPTALTNPGYIAFQNGRLIVANNNSTNWYLSAPNNARSWPSTANSVGALQSKPDTVQAAVPTPGGGNNLYLFGHNVIEQWQDVGAALFPYQRASTFNVDFGTVNASSIASMDRFVVWISSNENSGATLMVIEGNSANQISTDGINYDLANLTNPSNCTGFLFRQDGHVIYQFTFPDDNLSFAYDFNTKEFFTVTDENLNYHIARQVVFFNNDYYFVSFRGGNLYDFGTEFTNFNYGDGIIHEIPRLRVTPPLRLPSQAMFIIKEVGFTIENGQPNTYTTSNGQVSASEAVDLSISRDGGESFGNSWRKEMNPTGKRQNRFRWQQCGQANDTTYQFRFSGFGRFVAFDGVVSVYQ